MSTSTALAEFKPQQAMVGLQQTIDWKDPELKALIKNTVAKGATDNELAYFCLLANSKKLNPLNKEIYFSAYGEGQGRKSFVMIGRHGMLTLAERHPEFRGLSSCEIRKNDEFSFNPITGEINHVLKLPKSEIIGAWATARREGRQPVTIVCWMDEYIKEKSEAWQKYKQDMIKFKAEKRVLEQLFKAEYQGLMVGDDYENVEPLPFSETHSPAPAIATIDDWIGDDKPASAAVVEPEKTKPQEEPEEEFIDNGQKANFAIKQNEYGIPDEVIAGWLIENGYSPTGSRATIYKSKFLEAKKGLKGLAKELANKQPESLDDAIKQQTLNTGTDTSYLEG